MAFRYSQKKCANCSHEKQVLEYYDDGKDSDYEGFLHYSNFEIQVCGKCGYIAEDIEKDTETYSANTKEYEKAKNYGYIPQELLQEYPYIFESYSANEYDCLAVRKKQNNNLHEYSRALFASILNTLAIVNELKHELTIEGDDLTEKESVDYKTIIKILNEEVKNKSQKIIELNIKENFNDEIIHLICLKILQKNAEFDKKLKEITPKISEQLKEYILEF